MFFLGCALGKRSYAGRMKTILTLLFLSISMTTASAITIAADARTERLLAKAHRHADAATRTYANQPSGTAHAVADAAYCNYTEQMESARLRGFELAPFDFQLDALKSHRASVQLSALQCESPHPSQKK